MDRKKVLTVSQFIGKVNKSLRPFSERIVEGEVSDFDSSRRGKWVGFSLKDEKTEQVLNCFTTRGKFGSWGMEGIFEEGMKVQVRGQVKVRNRGNFSMFVKELRLAGEGSLKKAYEKLKKKLKKEGLFARERKREIPRFPQNIGLITSKEARAYSDFLKGLRARMGGLKIYHIDVHVQGRNAIPEICNAFDFFNKKHEDFELDLITLLRGGGSLEDLQAFNSEKIARVVFSSEVPVVCGVGHEEDVTLAGKTADLRASTPSNTAELIVPTREETQSRIENLEYKMRTSLDNIVEEKHKKVDNFLRAGRKFHQQKIQKIENLFLKFFQSFDLYKKEVKSYEEKIERNIKNLKKNSELWINNLKQEIKQKERLLKSYSPKAVLRRGYSIVEKKGKIVKSVENLGLEDMVKIKLHKGNFNSIIKEIKSD